MTLNNSIQQNFKFLNGGGEMGEICRSINWSATVLGSPETWPQSLRTTLSIILNSKFPMFLFWGPDLICFYNDAYRPSLGNKGKHPAVGQKGKDLWPEIWDDIKPLIDNVLNGGEASWSEDQLLPIYRNGQLEDVYWTFSYSPVADESGKPAGVFVTCTETTDKVISLKDLQHSNASKQLLNDEIKKINHELETTITKLSKSNEEQALSNKELITTQLNLSESLKNLSESEERFRVMAEATDVLISVDDETGKATFFNKAWVNITGKSTRELLEFGYVKLIHDDDQPDYLTNYTQAFKNKVPFTGEFRLLNSKGNYVWLLVNGVPLFKADQSFKGYINSCVDITERKIDDIRKNDFISMVSHELKTPLTSISAITQILKIKLKDQKDPFFKNILDQANVQVKKMSAMINGFLNISRFESGKIQLTKKQFNLAELLVEMINEIKLTTTSHNFIIERCADAVVNADKEKIGTVISNLLNNAVKYSPAGKNVFINCETSNNMVIVSITDEGIGIKPEDQEKLFDRYYRVQNAKTDHISGFGIGLYLSIEIIQFHDGKIWVNSEFGKGSTFNFSLPVLQ